MKKIFVIEENDAQELVKNAIVVMNILNIVLGENKIDEITRKKLSSAVSAIEVVNDILGK